MSKHRASDDDETDFGSLAAWDTHNETMAYGTPALGTPDDEDSADDPWSTPVNHTQRYAPRAPVAAPPAVPRSVRAQLEADVAARDDWGAGMNRTQVYTAPPPTTTTTEGPPGARASSSTPAQPTRAPGAPLTKWVLAPPAGVDRDVPTRLSSLRSLKRAASAGEAFRLAPPDGVDDA